MTRGAGTTPAWVVPGAWPGSGDHVASSVVSQQSRFSDFREGRGSSGIFPDGSAEKTKVVGVLPGIGALPPSGGGTGCTSPYFLFSGINACAIDGETNLLVTTPTLHLAWGCLVWALRLPRPLRYAVPGCVVGSNFV